jgi:branched-chain amino acid transport system ATP-binding protein
MSIFDVEALVAAHGLLPAVREVSFKVARGEVLAIIGANGAGKTTLFRALAGVHPVTGGHILLEGRDITRMSAHRRVRAGISLAPEGRRLFGEMTVKENLLVAGENGRNGLWTLDTVLDALPQLKPLTAVKAGSLSGGQRQAVAIGRALMANPKVLLLDEVSLGLSPVAIEGLYENLLELRHRRDTTIILVEQDLDRALAFSDRMICMLEGRAVLYGASAYTDRAAITSAYFGMEAAPEHTRTRARGASSPAVPEWAY